MRQFEGSVFWLYIGSIFRLESSIRALGGVGASHRCPTAVPFASRTRRHRFCASVRALLCPSACACARRSIDILRVHLNQGARMRSIQRPRRSFALKLGALVSLLASAVNILSRARSACSLYLLHAGCRLRSSTMRRTTL